MNDGVAAAEAMHRARASVSYLQASPLYLPLSRHGPDRIRMFTFQECDQPNDPQ